MSRTLLSAALMAGFATSALADCSSEIDALFDGPLDSFNRAPHHQVMTTLGADGAAVMTFDQWVETPVIYASQQRGQPTITVIRNQNMWQAPGFDGPWKSLGAVLPGDRVAWQRKQDSDRRANMTDPECPGLADVDGTALVLYRFHTRTEPDEHGAWFAGRWSVFLDPSDGQLLRLETRENAAHYAPDPDDKTVVVQFDYSGARPIPDPES